ncbi:cytochrome o ubiquinol oxidase subunit IV [Vitreoscilla massiliensis]|mgnify:CR=1 FL=1|uniref:Cytochrome bo(3) ubiquinol oxidase subunit 4 n=1 Tax=Vitreoscilla massiliensis TaxID=1689272 RepID=A0ABY4E351_9NEIS|nr:cytochrome o ubiquinol oxidase subunit IV [Vitreoscilla massiliensis]UOO90202.1 cytochrome o ubiquinol oxidase subunit IV [Vitreoscilla massiliensis]
MSGNNHVNAHQDHGSAKQYVVGFIISIILTVIPFFMVMNGGFPKGLTVAVLVITMIAQVWVQLVWFLHMKREDSQKWQVLSFWYTFLTIAILFIGSVWILSELHTFMM